MVARLRLLIARSLHRVSSAFTWQSGVKSARAWMGPFLTIGAILAGKVSPFLSLGLISLCRSITALVRSQGIAGAALYLKACTIYLQRYLANDALLDRKAFGPVIGLTRRGLPLVIPSAWRRAIASGNHVVARLVLTVFGLYRVLEFRGKFSIKTIVTPWGGSLPPRMLEFIPIFLSMLRFEFPKRFRWRPSPILTRSPTAPGADRSSGTPAQTSMRGFGNALLGIFGSPLEAAFADYARLVKLHSQWGSLRRIWELTYSHAGPAPNVPLGKLSLKDEPGKVRVFALVDVITQWMLMPLHEMLFGILRGISQDATFDQDAGVMKVKEALSAREPNRRFVFSFDLSAATDRLPIILQIALLNAMKEGLGTAWAAILTNRDYWLGDKRAVKEPTPIRYATGQPMGALSSWAMLALTHHLIVQYCSWILGNTTWFKDYMVLGDDIVIYDRAIANKYLEVMSTLGVDINLSKSLRSNIGTFEFAKRLVTVEGPIQGIPLALLQGARYNLSVLLEFLRGFNGTVRLATALQLLGFGYRVKGSTGIILPLPGRAAFARLLFTQPGLTASSAVDWGHWFSQGKPATIHTVWAILYKLWNGAREVPVTGRVDWLSILGLPEDLPIDAARNVEMLFENMFTRISQTVTDRYTTYVTDLETMSVPLNDVNATINKLVPQFSEVPVGDVLLSDWESLTAWTDYHAEDPTMNTTPSEMMSIVYRESEYSHQASQWKLPPAAPPVSGDSPWDVQIID
nr:MAG: putative RNA-dependent RNA polymerase [Mitoviridae sp.]